MDRRPTLVACAVVLTMAVPAVRSQQATGEAAPTRLEVVELSTPFTVREVKGRIYSARRHPLEDAYFGVDLHNNSTGTYTTSTGIYTDASGSFKFTAPRDPFAWLVAPMWRIGRGAHRFTASQTGFHSTVGTLIVSPDAPKDNVIEIFLQPGPDADDRTPEERATAWDNTPLPACASGPAGNPNRYKHPSAVADIPVALGRCGVRTGEIPVAKRSRYRFMLEVESSAGYYRVNCMMGLAATLDMKYCVSTDPVLKADWVVWAGGQVLSRGSSPVTGAGSWGQGLIEKTMGRFDGDPGKTYAVEVKFLKDAAALNTGNPHLIVLRTD